MPFLVICDSSKLEKKNVLSNSLEGVVMKIGLDFDNVMVQTDRLKPIVAKDLFGVEIPLANYNKELILTKRLLTEDQYQIVARKVYRGGFGPESLLPVPGTLEYIPMLQNLGHVLCVVTSRSVAHNNLHVVSEWLRLYGFDLPVTGIEYGVPKTEACRDLDVFVDDDLAILAPMLGILKHPMLFDLPYKNWGRIDDRVIVVNSWDSLYMYIYMLDK